MQTLNRNTPRLSKLSMPTEEKSATQNAHSINPRSNLYIREELDPPSKRRNRLFWMEGYAAQAEAI
jgi:hypothetical protein